MLIPVDSWVLTSIMRWYSVYVNMQNDAIINPRPESSPFGCDFAPAISLISDSGLFIKGGFMSEILMKCGCVANGTCSAEAGVKYDPPIPVCYIHDCFEQSTEPFDLTGRTAQCFYKNCKTYLAKYGDTHYGELRENGRSYAPSSLKLPFFRYSPEEEYDEYFCGCMGWD